jgi:hypothetical protein
MLPFDGAGVLLCTCSADMRHFERAVLVLRAWTACCRSLNAGTDVLLLGGCGAASLAVTAVNSVSQMIIWRRTVDESRVANARWWSGSSR